MGPAISKYHAFHFHQGEQIGERLKALQIDPNSIQFIINSHLHFDHCGGNEQLPNADIIVQRKEVDHAKTVDHRHGYVAKEWETGQKFRLVEGEHDLFNDGTVVCIPTYGHTPGHQSLRVQTEKGGEFLLCGDACYLKESLEKLSLPGIISDREAALSVLKRFREMRARGVNIVFGHDPDFWKTIPKAPTRLG